MPSSSDALILCMRNYGFVLPRNAIEWRVDGRFGHLPSLGIHSCRILCTDGLLAYFVLGDDKTLLYGHLAAFVEIKKDSDKLAGPKATKSPARKTPRKRDCNISDALALLAKLAVKSGAENKTEEPKPSNPQHPPTAAGDTSHEA